jgi:hypothetical protein
VCWNEAIGESHHHRHRLGDLADRLKDARIRDKMCKHRQFTPRTRNRFRERELARAVARSEKRRRRAREDRDPQSGNISVILPCH